MRKIFLYLTCVLLVSCKKFLDTTPKDFISPDNYFETEEQAQYVLNGVYSTLTQNETYGSNMLGRMALDGDECWNHYTGDRFTVADNNFGANEARILSYWKEFYSGINKANLFLENIGKVQMDEQKKKVMTGEALFLRSYFYLMLVNRFGGVPLILETIKSGDAASIQTPQTPAKEIYDKIITDMEAAADMVEDAATVGMGGRINKSAVWGILARTCLYAAGHPINDVSRYDDAKKWAEQVIQTGTHSLNPDFKQIFINHVQDKYDIKESIWEVEFWGNGTGIYTNLGGYVGRNNGIGNTQDPDIGYAAGMTRITGPMFKRFAQDDLRRDWAIAPFRYVGNPGVATDWSESNIYQRYCGKWRRTYELILPRSTTRTPTNFPLLRYADVLLMFAEADNEVSGGPTPAAYEAINQVRRRGYGLDPLLPNASVDLAGMDQQSFLAELQDERSRELGFECLRKSDLVRWNIFLPSMQLVTNDLVSYSGDFYDFPKRTFGSVTGRHELWPIPSFELGLNPHLVQNPGW